MAAALHDTTATQRLGAGLEGKPECLAGLSGSHGLQKASMTAASATERRCIRCRGCRPRGDAATVHGTCTVGSYISANMMFCSTAALKACSASPPTIGACKQPCAHPCCVLPAGEGSERSRLWPRCSIPASNSQHKVTRADSTGPSTQPSPLTCQREPARPMAAPTSASSPGPEGDSAVHRGCHRGGLLEHAQPLLIGANLLLLLRQRLSHAAQLVRRQHRRCRAAAQRRRPRRHLPHGAQLALQQRHARAQRPRILLQRRGSRLKGGQLLVSKPPLRARRRPGQRPVQLGQETQPLPQVPLRPGKQAGRTARVAQGSAVSSHRRIAAGTCPPQPQGAVRADCKPAAGWKVQLNQSAQQLSRPGTAERARPWRPEPPPPAPLPPPPPPRPPAAAAARRSLPAAAACAAGRGRAVAEAGSKPASERGSGVGWGGRQAGGAEQPGSPHAQHAIHASSAGSQRPASRAGSCWRRRAGCLHTSVRSW